MQFKVTFKGRAHEVTLPQATTVASLTCSKPAMCIWSARAATGAHLYWYIAPCNGIAELLRVRRRVACLQWCSQAQLQTRIEEMTEIPPRCTAPLEAWKCLPRCRTAA